MFCNAVWQRNGHRRLMMVMLARTETAASSQI